MGLDDIFEIAEVVSTDGEGNLDRFVSSCVVKEDHQLEVRNEVSVSHHIEIETEERNNVHDKSKEDLKLVTEDDIKREVEAAVERIMIQKFTTSRNTYDEQLMKVFLQSQYINILHHCSMICR